MADPNFSWVYLIIFLAIPLARIIPRILAKRQMKNYSSHRTQEEEEQFQNNLDEPIRKATEHVQSSDNFLKPQTKTKLVLGELNKGATTFEKIQKNTGFNNEELDSILEDLESKGMLKVQQRQGLFGSRIELHLTDKGFKEFYT